MNYKSDYIIPTGYNIACEYNTCDLHYLAPGEKRRKNNFHFQYSVDLLFLIFFPKSNVWKLNWKKLFS